ncbi:MULTISPECIES: NAD(P)H-quinone oxidoreductase [unclassified Beijerinckia]|uniref:NAD(P)H-quinone oxidoreductase n=1 Tax=unclassified Beijerinckia TaxID=2638183 RepID=UPI000897DBDF|nr:MULTISPECIES: NAD(P)H-quinone oxidoreductase [unclassified Beijerinckia]MDH7795304.1 NADPH2:quinone reductase [Beijerinckia sp. GAS462]SEB96015.1 putative NAD(P)H quinone oxidoreductase, PIG3 family [Beijerinckia sp. 28-YEA-48]
MLPTSMKVAEIKQPGGPEVLTLATRPVPAPGPGDILIKVAAAGVNRPDVVQRSGHYPPPPGASDLPGLEAAGTVAALGEGVSRWKVGDAVTALLPGGGYAEYVTTPADHALPVPKGFSMIEAAGLCETFYTVWGNLFMRGKLRAGETVLIHGGTSGIGTTAIMLAVAKGATVYATAGSDEKCATCLKLGATRAINYRSEDFVQVMKEATGGKGVDVVLDIIGGDYIPRNLQTLALEGRLVQIAFLGGVRSVTIDVAQIMMKRLTVTGSTLRPQSVPQKAKIARELEEHVWPLLNAGTIHPLVDSVYPLGEAAEAHRRMESSVHIGKIILDVQGS